METDGCERSVIVDKRINGSIVVEEARGVAAEKTADDIYNFICRNKLCMAERVGFEPTVGIDLRRFSRPLP